MTEIDSDIPDFLGKASRVHSVASLLQSGQEQLQRLDHVRIFNHRSWGDLVDLTENEQAPYTYEHRRESLLEGMKKLLDNNEDIKEELIAEAVARRRQVERQIERSLGE